MAVFALVALIPLVALAGCVEQNGANFLNPSAPQALQEANLFWFILVVATVIFVPVTGALIYSVIRFRARPGSPAARQFSGNTPLELVWTIVPSIVLLGVLVLTINTLFVGLAPYRNFHRPGHWPPVVLGVSLSRPEDRHGG